MSSPIIILVEPQMGENIGATARAMKNFECHELRIVNPRDGWPNKKAIAVAAGGEDIIHQAQLFPSLHDACADLTFTFATSATMRDLHKEVVSLPNVQNNLPQGKYGIIFGREKSGLTNSEISIANTLLHIPTSKAFSSLNLGQAVLAVCYQIFTHKAPDIEAESNEVEANIGEVQLMLEHLFINLDKANYFKHDQNSQLTKDKVSNFFKRVPSPSRSEINQLRGIIRNLSNE